MERSRLATLILASLVFMAGACGGQEPGTDGTDGPPMAATVRGQVIEVKAASLIKLESLTVRDGAGMLWTFGADNFVGFTPAHLREHQAFGQTVSVFYTEGEDGRLVIVEVTD